MRRLLLLLSTGVMLTAGTAWGATLEVTMRLVDSEGVGAIIGVVEFEDSAKGLKINPNLSGLSEGEHGFHVHENPDCGPAEKDGSMVPALAAGGHYDPENTGKHLGPQGDGHLGDLPVLYVAADGTATRSDWAPRLTTDDLVGRAIMIHSGGDTYSDEPHALGGGGSRVACGVVVVD